MIPAPLLQREPGDFHVNRDRSMQCTRMRSLPTFDAIYRDYFRRIFGRARRMGLRRDEAEDVTQDVFTALYQAMNDGRVNATFIAEWLYVVTRRKTLRHIVVLRHQGAPAPIVGTDLEPQDATMHDTARRVAADDRWLLVGRLLDDLDPALRKVFVLREINEETLDATATTLKRPMSTVKTQHDTAREQFDAALARHRAKERRTSRGAASMFLPVVPVTSFVRRVLGWFNHPVALIASRAGLTVATGIVFAAGTLTGILASKTHDPAPGTRLDSPAPILAAAPAPVEEAHAPAATAPVVASAAPSPAMTPPRSAAVLNADAEKDCLTAARARLTPPRFDPDAAIRMLDRCERRFPQRLFPEQYIQIRQQAQDALAHRPQQP